MRPSVQAMLFLQAIGGEPMIGYSDFTHKWYTTDHIEIGGDGLLRGATVHRDTPEAAIVDLFEEYKQTVPYLSEKYLVTRDPERRHWQWNGACFMEVPQRER